jgi:excisionase family DNA binding protein
MSASLTAVLEVPALLSVAQAGQVLGCSSRTVRRRIADGTLPAVLEHGRVMVRGDDLRAYIDDLQRLGPAQPRRRPRARPARHDFSFLAE